jgi:hypothetical protein
LFENGYKLTAAATADYEQRDKKYPDPVVVKKSAKAVACHESILLRKYTYFALRIVILTIILC